MSLTLSVLVPGICVLVGHVVLGYSLASFCLYMLGLGLVAGAALTLWNNSNFSTEGSRIQPPMITVTAAGVAQFSGALGSRLGGALERYNALLQWQAPLESARALAYIYLVLQLLFLVTPVNFIAAYVLSFVLVPAYLFHARPLWLRARAEHIEPSCKWLSSAAQEQVDYLAKSGILGLAAVVITGIVTLYLLSEVLSVVQITTGAAPLPPPLSPHPNDSLVCLFFLTKPLCFANAHSQTPLFC